MTAVLIIAAWLTICALILLANHCFKLSRKTEGNGTPDHSAEQPRIGIGQAGELITHHGKGL